MKCGQPAPTPNPPAQPQSSPAQAQPASQSAVAPKAKKSGWGKVFAVIAGILLLLFVTAIAAALYGVHWLKNKVASFTGGGSSAQVKVENGNSCSLLSRDELQQVLGIAIEKNAEIVEQSDPGCAYYTNPQAFAQLQKMALEQARRDSEQASKQPGPKTDNPLELLKNTNQMEGVVKGLGLTQPDKEGRVFSFTVQHNVGPESWSAFRTTISIVPGFEDVPGVGDHAMMGSFGHAFYVLKGDNMVHLDLTYIPDAKTRGADIGRKIAAHL
jgi:hypothetical protein